MKKLILLTVVAVAVGMGGFVMGLRINGLALPDAVEMARNVFKARTVFRTTDGVVAEIEKAKPHLAALAKDAGAKLRINVFKELALPAAVGISIIGTGEKETRHSYILLKQTPQLSSAENCGGIIKT